MQKVVIFDGDALEVWREGDTQKQSICVVN